MSRKPYRDALRVLFIIRAGATPLEPTMQGIVSIFRGEARLHAFDFWIRNPDYLAAELLDLFEANHEAAYLRAVESIFANEEPDLRRLPMIRYFFGAFEPLDDSLSLLRSRELIQITGVKHSQKVQETDFLLTDRGEQFCLTCLREAPPLSWYSDRAQLVALIAGDRAGSALKQKQYERASYAETAIGGIIPSIAAETAARLKQLKMAAQEWSSESNER
jgi:hypothetical protein